MAEQMSIV